MTAEVLNKNVVASDGLKAWMQALVKETNSINAGSLMFLEGTSSRWNEENIIPTGSIDLDMAIGVGGWPRGRMIELYGQESSGKTTLALHGCREYQRLGGGIVYIDAENALDPKWIKQIGIDSSAFSVAQPRDLEDGIGLMRDIMRNIPADQPGVLFVLDSIAALVPREVLEAPADKEPSRAPAARIWSRQLPVITQLLNETGSTLIMINQMRDSMDMYTPNSTPGGKAIKFYATIRAEVKRRVPDKNDPEGASGQETRVKVIKNKVGSPFKEAYYFISAGQPIDPALDIINAALKYCNEGGYLYTDTKYEDGDWKTKKGWYSYELQPGDVDAIDKDDLEGWIAAGEAEDEFESQYSKESVAVTLYQSKRMREWMLAHPTLLEMIRERILDGLNDSEQAILPEDEAPVSDLDLEDE